MKKRFIRGALLSACIAFVLPNICQAQFPSGTITGGGNPVPDIILTLTGSDGVMCTATTDAAGFYSFDGCPTIGGDESCGPDCLYTLAIDERSVAKTLIYQLPLGPEGGAARTVSCTDVVDIPLNPIPKCDAPNLITPCFLFEGESSDFPNDGSMVSFPTSAAFPGGPGNVSNTYLANFAETGAMGGIAYDPCRNTVYGATIAMRHTDTGPGADGILRTADDYGAIYVMPAGGGGVSSVITIPNANYNSAFNLTVPPNDANFPVGAPTLPRMVDTVALSAVRPGLPGWALDSYVFDTPGKMGLGDIQMSEDCTKLFVVNLADRHLYYVDLTTPANTVVDVGPIQGPGCPSGEWRPWALEWHGGDLYVGGVCSAEGVAPGARPETPTPELSAHVYRFCDPCNSTAADLVYSQDLDYGKDQKVNGMPATGVPDFWGPWIEQHTPDVEQVQAATDRIFIEYIAPMLTDIEFQVDGSLALGFRDRGSDQYKGGNGTLGAFLPNGPTTAPRTLGTRIREHFSSGDVRKACWVDSSSAPAGEILTTQNCVTPGVPVTSPMGYWEEEGGPNCPQNTGRTEQEFYNEDGFDGGGKGNHSETAQGHLALLAGCGQVVTTTMDPYIGFANVRSGGVSFYNDFTGGRDAAYSVFVTDQANTPGKGNGLGDVEFTCGNEPVQVGGTVWCDCDLDGLYDPFEAPQAGIPVSIFSNGVLIASTTTDANGHWFFADIAANNDFYVELTVTEALTIADANNNMSDAQDSDAYLAGGVARIDFKTIEGRNKHDLGTGLICGPFVLVDETQALDLELGCLYNDNTAELFYPDADSAFMVISDQGDCNGMTIDDILSVTENTTVDGCETCWERVIEIMPTECCTYEPCPITQRVCWVTDLEPPKIARIPQGECIGCVPEGMTPEEYVCVVKPPAFDIAAVEVVENCVTEVPLCTPLSGLTLEIGTPGICNLVTTLGDPLNAPLPNALTPLCDNNFQQANQFAASRDILGTDNNYVLRWTGFINIPAAGTWRFETRSDDGSLLYINGNLIANNDGCHGAIDRDGTVMLTEGCHEIGVVFNESGGGDFLSVRWENLAAGIPEQEIPDSALYTICCDDETAVTNIPLDIVYEMNCGPPEITSVETGGYQGCLSCDTIFPTNLAAFAATNYPPPAYEIYVEDTNFPGIMTDTCVVCPCPWPLVSVIRVEQNCPGGEPLNILEIEAFNTNGVNVALGGTAFSPNGACCGSSFGGVIDGITSAGCCGQLWHSSQGGPGVYIDVTLAAPTQIDQINVLPRINCCPRLANYNLILFDANGKEIYRENRNNSTDCRNGGMDPADNIFMIPDLCDSLCYGDYDGNCGIGLATFPVFDLNTRFVCFNGAQFGAFDDPNVLVALADIPNTDPRFSAETNYEIGQIGTGDYLTQDQLGLCADDFVVRVCSTFEVPAGGGAYTFELTGVDDLAIAFVDGVAVVQRACCGGIVGAPVNLTAGRHDIKFYFGERAGGQGANLFINGPGLPRQLLQLNPSPYLGPGLASCGVYETKITACPDLGAWNTISIDHVIPPGSQIDYYVGYTDPAAGVVNLGPFTDQGSIDLSAVPATAPCVTLQARMFSAGTAPGECATPLIESIKASYICGIAPTNVLETEFWSITDSYTTNGCDVTLDRTYRVETCCGLFDEEVVTFSYTKLPDLVTGPLAKLEVGCIASVDQIPPVDLTMFAASSSCEVVSIEKLSETMPVQVDCEWTYTRSFLVETLCNQTTVVDQVVCYTLNNTRPEIVSVEKGIDHGCQPAGFMPPFDTDALVVTNSIVQEMVCLDLPLPAANDNRGRIFTNAFNAAPFVFDDGTTVNNSRQQYHWLNFSDELLLLPAGSSIISAELVWPGAFCSTADLNIEIGAFPVPDASMGLPTVYSTYANPCNLPDYYGANTPIDSITAMDITAGTATWDISSLLGLWAAGNQPGELMLIPDRNPFCGNPTPSAGAVCIQFAGDPILRLKYRPEATGPLDYVTVTNRYMTNDCQVMVMREFRTEDCCGNFDRREVVHTYTVQPDPVTVTPLADLDLGCINSMDAVPSPSDLIIMASSACSVVDISWCGDTHVQNLADMNLLIEQFVGDPSARGWVDSDGSATFEDYYPPSRDMAQFYPDGSAVPAAIEVNDAAGNVTASVPIPAPADLCAGSVITLKFYAGWRNDGNWAANNANATVGLVNTTDGTTLLAPQTITTVITPGGGNNNPWTLNCVQIPVGANDAGDVLTLSFFGGINSGGAGLQIADVKVDALTCEPKTDEENCNAGVLRCYEVVDLCAQTQRITQVIRYGCELAPPRILTVGSYTNTGCLGDPRPMQLNTLNQINWMGGITTLNSSTGAVSACVDVVDGTGWLLVGRGREGWTFDTAGPGNAGALKTGLGTPAAFPPAALDNTTIDALLAAAGKTAGDLEIRLKRATNPSGTAYQEVRWCPTGAPAAWTWDFDAGGGPGSYAVTQEIVSGPLTSGPRATGTRDLQHLRTRLHLGLGGARRPAGILLRRPYPQRLQQRHQLPVGERQRKPRHPLHRGLYPVERTVLRRSNLRRHRDLRSHRGGLHPGGYAGLCDQRLQRHGDPHLARRRLLW